MGFKASLVRTMGQCMDLKLGLISAYEENLAGRSYYCWFREISRNPLCGAQSPVAWGSCSAPRLALQSNKRGREVLAASHVGEAGFSRPPPTCILGGRGKSGRTALLLPTCDSLYYDWRSSGLRKFLRDPENTFFTIHSRF